jgi:hypothetical protein
MLAYKLGANSIVADGKGFRCIIYIFDLIVVLYYIILVADGSKNLKKKVKFI